MIKNDIKIIHEFLKGAQTYYLATVDKDQPRVRPFGTATLFEDKIYVLTGKSKDVSKQLLNNAKFEISTMDTTGRWIRILGKLIEDNRVEVHEALLNDYPHLKNAYTVGGDNTNALYMEIENAAIYSFTAEPQILS